MKFHSLHNCAPVVGHHRCVATMVGARSEAFVMGDCVQAHPLHVWKGWGTNPGENYREEHKPIQESQDTHDCKHAKIVKPECMVPARKFQYWVSLENTKGDDSDVPTDMKIYCVCL